MENGQQPSFGLSTKCRDFYATALSQKGWINLEVDGKTLTGKVEDYDGAGKLVLNPAIGTVYSLDGRKRIGFVRLVEVDLINSKVQMRVNSNEEEAKARVRCYNQELRNSLQGLNSRLFWDLDGEFSDRDGI